MNNEPLDFWNYPDWGERSNLRDPGTEPFWMRPAKRPDPLRQILKEGTPRPVAHGRTRVAGNLLYEGHSCGPFVQLWTGYRYCEVCEEPSG